MVGMDDHIGVLSATLTNPLGLHARPSVKLTRLAKSFASEIEIAAGTEEPWTDAKSIVKVMALTAAKGVTLRFRAKGPDAAEALAALKALVVSGFAEDEGFSEQPEPLNG
jgi:phosphocarrier protein HPr